MIDIVNLKSEIENNKFNRSLLICVCKDVSAKFIANQYLHYYAKKNGLEIKEREDIISYLATLDMFQEPTVVYVHEVEELSYEPLKEDNIWVVCSKVRKKVAKEYDEYIVEFPKLEPWQLKDYVASVAGVTEEQAESLISTYQDINKLDIEIKKLSIFKNNMYDELIDQLISNEDMPIFDLANALIKRDKAGVANFVKTQTEVDPYKFLGLILKNLKAVIDIQLAKNPTAESTGLSGKQFWAVQKYSCGHYSREELMYLYEQMTGIDARIKSGEIDTQNVVNYIISQFLQFMR